MRKSVWMAGAAALLFALAANANAQNVKRAPINRINDVTGPATFKAYCTQCHGADGKGAGPVAKALKIPPADLTRIAERHGGKFPAVEVKHIIMGEQDLPAHGTRDMPTWGPAFRSVEDSSVSELRLSNLVRYLEELQVKK